MGTQLLKRSRRPGSPPRTAGGTGVRVSGRKKAGAEGDRPVCNAVQNEKTGETAPAWHRHFQTGSSKWKTRPRAVDEVEDLIGGDAAGIRGGEAVRWRSRPVRCGGGGGAWGSLPRRRMRGPRSSLAKECLPSVKDETSFYPRKQGESYIDFKSNPRRLPADVPVCQGRIFWRIRSGSRQKVGSRGFEPFF